MNEGFEALDRKVDDVANRLSAGAERKRDNTDSKLLWLATLCKDARPQSKKG